MTPTQRAAAERLAPVLNEIANSRAPSAAGFAVAEAAALLRAALAEPVADKTERLRDEHVLRRLLALRSGIPHLYLDDGEAQGEEQGIRIDFMREPVADLEVKLLALNAARMECREPQGEQIDALPAGLLTVEHRPGIAYSGAMRRYEPIQSLPDGEHKLYTQATLQREQDEVLRLEGEVARLRINSARYRSLLTQARRWWRPYAADTTMAEIYDTYGVEVLAWMTCVDEAMKETPCIAAAQSGRVV